jgi:hypothetical protein
MAAIASISVTRDGDFAAALATLGADDTITFTPGKAQLLVLRNPTGGTLVATVDGTTSTTVNAPGVGTVDVSGGKAISVGAGLSRAVLLSSISAYCSGVVHITGGTGLVAQLFDI